MVGALPMMGCSVAVDSHVSRCLRVDALPFSNASFRSCCGDLGMQRKQSRRVASLDLSSSFVDAWQEERLSSKALSAVVRRQTRRQKRHRNPVIVDELGGQYEDSFEDVTLQILNYFTYKAVKTVLNQLYEMNPPMYIWFYEFVATHSPADGKGFIRTLVKEKQQLAERVMTTRLHLYGKWIKKCDHAKIYQEISDQNLELMRERLMETVVWPSDDTNTEKIG